MPLGLHLQALLDDARRRFWDETHEKDGAFYGVYSAVSDAIDSSPVASAPFVLQELWSAPDFGYIDTGMIDGSRMIRDVLKQVVEAYLATALLSDSTIKLEHTLRSERAAV